MHALMWKKKQTNKKQTKKQTNPKTKTNKQQKKKNKKKKTTKKKKRARVLSIILAPRTFSPEEDHLITMKTSKLACISLTFTFIWA